MTSRAPNRAKVVRRKVARRLMLVGTKSGKPRLLYSDVVLFKIPVKEVGDEFLESRLAVALIRMNDETLNKLAKWEVQEVKPKGGTR